MDREDILEQQHASQADASSGHDAKLESNSSGATPRIENGSSSTLEAPARREGQGTAGRPGQQRADRERGAVEVAEPQLPSAALHFEGCLGDVLCVHVDLVSIMPRALPLQQITLVMAIMQVRLIAYIASWPLTMQYQPLSLTQYPASADPATSYQRHSQQNEACMTVLCFCCRNAVVYPVQSRRPPVQPGLAAPSMLPWTGGRSWRAGCDPPRGHTGSLVNLGPPHTASAKPCHGGRWRSWNALWLHRRCLEPL